jgi:DnaK suppressor protein
MTDEEQDELARRLRAMEAELRAMIEGVEEQAQPVSLDAPIGRLSRMDALQQQQMADAQGQMARQRLSAVTTALQRLEAGTYGDCLQCGEPIDVRRLRVKPESPLCLACQSRRES